ncbi:MAG: hypothetical protein GXO83_04555 [Chlorobi bacterium]|nr:hypothetical protein [Chlorobiota bacterium]
MKSRLFILTLILACTFPLQAQVFHFPLARLLPAPGPEKYYLDNRGKATTDNNGPGIQYQILLQSGFFGSPGYGNGFSYSVTPTFGYTVSPRFRLSGGISYTAFSGAAFETPGAFENRGIPQRMTGNTVIFARGTYMVRPNLFFTGTIVKNLNRNRSPFLQNPYYRQPGDSYSLQMDYFLTKSIRFGAEFRYGNNSYPGFGYPYGYGPYLPWY